MNRRERRRARKRHCDAECPRCLTHTDSNEPSAPKVTGITTTGQVALDTAEVGTEVDVEVNFYCPSCGVAWTGTAIAQAVEDDD